MKIFDLPIIFSVQLTQKTYTSIARKSVGFSFYNSNKININKVRDFSSYTFDCAIKSLNILADKLGDTTWKKRLDLSIASAYLGGLTRLNDPKYLALVFIQGLKYLNQFVREL